MVSNYTYVDHLQVLLPLWTAAVFANWDCFWYADEEVPFPVFIDNRQVIKGFCDKSDGKDKLTALIQVGVMRAAAFFKPFAKFWFGLVTAALASTLLDCSTCACFFLPMSLVTSRRSKLPSQQHVKSSVLCG
jgi:hypothetical protein